MKSRAQRKPTSLLANPKNGAARGERTRRNSRADSRPRRASWPNRGSAIRLHGHPRRWGSPSAARKRHGCVHAPVPETGYTGSSRSVHGRIAPHRAEARLPRGSSDDAYGRRRTTGIQRSPPAFRRRQDAEPQVRSGRADIGHSGPPRGDPHALLPREAKPMKSAAPCPEKVRPTCAPDRPLIQFAAPRSFLATRPRFPFQCFSLK